MSNYHFAIGSSELFSRLGLVLRVFVFVLIAGIPIVSVAAPIIIDGQVFDAENGEVKRFIIGPDNNGSRIRNCTFKNYNNVDGYIISIDGASDVIIENCKFLNSRGKSVDVDIHAIRIPSKANNITIRNNLFENIGADGFQAGNSGNQVTNIFIDNNTFSVTATGFSVGENGIDLKETTGPIYIRNNTFKGFRTCVKDKQRGCTGSDGSGLTMHIGTRNVIVDGNYFFNNNHGLTLLTGENLPINDIIIKNNVFHKSVNDGLGVKIGNNIQIHNNTFVDNKTNLNWLTDAPTKVTNKNNLFVGTGGSTNKYGGEGNLVVTSVAAAKFVNAAAADFRLTGDSPARNRGVTVSSVQTDKAGVKRPQESVYDVGAYEYNGGQSPSSASASSSVAVPSSSQAASSDAESSSAAPSSKPASSAAPSSKPASSSTVSSRMVSSTPASSQPASSSQATSSAPSTTCINVINVVWGERAELTVNNGSCIAFDRNLSGNDLQVWNSDINTSCDYRGTLTSVNGSGSLAINSNYVTTATLTGTQFKFTTSNNCSFVKVRAY